MITEHELKIAQSHLALEQAVKLWCSITCEGKYKTEGVLDTATQFVAFLNSQDNPSKDADPDKKRPQPTKKG